MHTFPSGSADDAAWQQWCTSLRPTTQIPVSVQDIDLPLRVVCCEALQSDQYEIKTVKPENWEFAAISHCWLQNDPWTAIEKRPYPAAGRMTVTAVKKISLLALARLCLSIGIKYFWLDCVCIDQKSNLEQAREILNMGKYYSMAAKTLIFPYGVDNVGPPLTPEGEAPVWHSRAWTLQEEAMAGEKATFVLYFSEAEGVGFDCKHDGMALNVNGNEERIQHFGSFVPDQEQDSHIMKPKRYLHLVPKSRWVDCRTVYACRARSFGEQARENALRVVGVDASQRSWTLWSALREMYRRDASREEDMVYGVLGLLGISLSPSSIRYGIHLRGALTLLVEAVHVDQRLLLTVIESYHGTFIDGYCALPAFKDPTAVPATRLNHLRTLGVASFQGHEGMLITAPAITVDLVRQIDESHPIKEALGVMQQELNDVLEEQGAMNIWGFSQAGPTRRRDSKGHAKIAPGTGTLNVTLIAVTQIETPASDLFRKRDGQGTPLTTFCCLVCSDTGIVKHKVGLALVVAKEHEWTNERHLVA